MGRQFAGICGARGSLYGCVVCNTYLTCSKELTSKAFTGSTGPATLFKRAWNVVYGRCEHRKMTTGWHTVRDVFCVTCNQKLGWMYEMAVSESQTYKETQVIIENANFEKIAGAIKDPLGEDRQEAPPAPNLEMSRYPLEAEKKSRPHEMLIGLLLLFLLSVTYGQVPPTDRNCGHDLANLWLDVVVVVDNSAPMTQEGLTEVAAQIVTVFGAGTRIGTNYIDKRTTRVGLVTYNTEATIQADLNRFQSPDDLFSTVFQILPNDLSTSEDVFLAKGIGAAEQLLAAGRKNNTRKNYKQMVIVYASAYNDEGEEDPRPIAERLKASGVSIATVAFDQTGDEEMIKLIGEIATPGFNFTNEDENLVKEIQTAMIQTNCYCSNLWTQYRETFEDPHSSKFGVCLRPVALTAGWTPAKFACQNMIQTGYMVTEYDQKKHDYVFKLVRNDTSFPEPYVYHIGLSYVNGGYAWQQPVGHALVPFQLNDSLWNPGFPTQSSTTTAVLNQQSSSAFRVGWQNVNQYTVSERYVCEVAACDTSTYCE